MILPGTAPLVGKRVLVTRAKEQAGELARLLEERGAVPHLAPSIEIHPASDPEPLARALHDLAGGAYQWVAFTSANGVRFVIDALGANRDLLKKASIAAIGPGTARALEANGIVPNLIAKESVGEGLADALALAQTTETTRTAGTSARILFPRALVSRDAAPDLLRARGFAVDAVPAYETRAPGASARNALLAGLSRLDAVTFTSSSTVTNLADFLGPEAAVLLQPLAVVSIGPITTTTCKSRGIRVDATATSFTLPGLVAALEGHFALPER
jgi:uroporphyrinogen III methyltransferase/synthase